MALFVRFWNIMFTFAEGFNSIILYMGFISKLFSKKNKDLQKTSNDSPRESDVTNVSDKDVLDYSNLSFDCNGWLTYPDGLKIRNVSSVLEKNEDEDKVLDIINETKKILGYNSGELFYSLHDKEGFGWAGGKLSALAFVGLWELFSNKLLCIISFKDKVLSYDEISQCIKSTKSYWINSMGMERGHSTMMEIADGIKEHSISQSFVEKVFEKKCNGDSMNTGKFEFKFENGFLTECKYDGYDSWIFDIDGFGENYFNIYLEHSTLSTPASKIVIGLQALYSKKISEDILGSSISCDKFAYDEYGECINYIAMGAFYNQFDIDQDLFIQTLNGKYEILSNNFVNGIKTTKIKAYGEVFTFTNGHTMPGEVIGKAIAENEESCDSAEGYVYVMTNSSIEGQVKIGKTTRDPYERAKELSSATGVPTPFVVVFYKPFKDCHFAEKTIHQYLEKKGYRVNNNREFFNMSIPEAIDVVQSMYAIEQKQA